MRMFGERRGRRASAFASLGGLVLLLGVLTGCDTSPVLLQGTVRTIDSGTPVSGLSVELYADDAEELVAQTVTSNAGNYRFQASTVEDGTYRLRIDGAWWPDAGTWDEAEPVHLGSGWTETIDVEVDEAGSLQGLVVSPSGGRLGDVVVAALDVDGQVVALTRTDADGKYRLGLAEEGGYRLLLADPTVSWPWLFVGADEPLSFVVDPEGDYSQHVGTIDISTGLRYRRATTGAFLDVGAGQVHSCGIDTSQKVICWGWDDADGRLAAPVGSFVEVEVGSNHSCALAADQTITCWGDSGDDAPEGTFTAVGTGDFHNCAIATDQTVTCWGGYWSGGEPVAPAGTFTAVAGGGDHDCAIGTDQSITCWGHNDNGQTDAPTDGAYVAIGAGANHTCAISSDQSITCWGLNDEGQTDAPTDGAYTAVVGGDHYSCALDVEGAISCWGINDAGQIEAPAGVFTSIAAGSHHSCAVAVDQSVTCWGTNWLGESDAPT